MAESKLHYTQTLDKAILRERLKRFVTNPNLFYTKIMDLTHDGLRGLLQHLEGINQIAYSEQELEQYYKREINKKLHHPLNDLQIEKRGDQHYMILDVTGKVGQGVIFSNTMD